METGKENSTIMRDEKRRAEGCSLTYAVCKIGGRWRLVILCRLEEGKLRFSDIRKQIPNITPKMLTIELRDLEKEGLVKRTAYAEVPPRVEYELTEIAGDLIPVWRQLENWGAKHKALQK